MTQGFVQKKFYDFLKLKMFWSVFTDECPSSVYIWAYSYRSVDVKTALPYPIYNLESPEVVIDRFEIMYFIEQVGFENVYISSEGLSWLYLSYWFY